MTWRYRRTWQSSASSNAPGETPALSIEKLVICCSLLSSHSFGEFFVCEIAGRACLSCRRRARRWHQPRLRVKCRIGRDGAGACAWSGIAKLLHRGACEDHNSGQQITFHIHYLHCCRTAPSSRGSGDFHQFTLRRHPLALESRTTMRTTYRPGWTGKLLFTAIPESTRFLRASR